MPNASKTLQRYKKYLKYTILLCKIHNINIHAIKKARRLLLSLGFLYFYGSKLNQRKDTKNN